MKYGGASSVLLLIVLVSCGGGSKGATPASGGVAGASASGGASHVNGGSSSGGNGTSSSGGNGTSSSGGNGTSSSGGRNASGGSSASNGGSGSLSDACSEAAACCAMLTGDLKQACNVAVSTHNDTDCQAAVASLEVQGYCSTGPTPDPMGGLPAVTLDGAWSDATIAADADQALYGYPVQPCGDGDVITAWLSTDDVKAVTAGRYSTSKKTWTYSGALNQHDGLLANTPALAVNENCDAMAAWLEGVDANSPGGGQYTLIANRTTLGTWGTPFVLYDKYPSPLRDVTLTLDDSGKAELGYDTNVADSGAISRQTLGASSADARVPMNTLTASGAGFAVLPTGEGLFVVAESGPAQSTPVTGQITEWTRAPDGTWSDPVALPAPPPDTKPFSVKVIPAGDRFYVTWEIGTGTSVAVQFPGKAFTLHDAPTDFSLQGASFAANGDNLFAYNIGPDSQPEQARVARFTSAGGWEKPIVVSAKQHTILNDVGVVVDSAGRATAVYSSPKVGIVANRFTPKAGWSGPQIVDTQGAAPHLAVDRRGRVFLSYGIFEIVGNKAADSLTIRAFMPDDLL